ncbi:MAG: hypothetical protein R3A13_02030 [Bdellovibrionota bacterium]
MNRFRKEALIPLFSLFTSAATLVCCALPALLVSLGMGAVMAGLVSDFPILISLSKNKGILFIVAAILLLAAGVSLYVSRNAPCPVDPAKAKWCGRLRKIGVLIYSLSVILYCIGLFFAYLVKFLI